MLDPKRPIVLLDILQANFRTMNANDLTFFQGIEGMGLIAELKKDDKEYLLCADVHDSHDMNKCLQRTKMRVEVYGDHDIGAPLQMFEIAAVELPL